MTTSPGMKAYIGCSDDLIEAHKKYAPQHPDFNLHSQVFEGNEKLMQWYET